jgi:hypothetical protein
VTPLRVPRRDGKEGGAPPFKSSKEGGADPRRAWPMQGGMLGAGSAGVSEAVML